MSDQPEDCGLPRYISEELQVSMLAVKTLYDMLIDAGVVSRATVVDRLRQITDGQDGYYAAAGLRRLVSQLNDGR